MIMKQYTEIWQTNELIRLGYSKPKSVSKLSLDLDMDTIPSFDYSIGELISLLPKNIAIQREEDKWKVSIGDVCITKAELIDALFELLK